MTISTFIIDAFTNEPFTGNPAGVCLLETALAEQTMQAIASELNLSETAFLQPSANENEYNIRYFTPTVEIDFCGHATLASAKLVLDKLGKSQVAFITHKGLELTAQKQGDYLQMKFPLYNTTEYTPSQALLDAFGISQTKSARYCKELEMLVIEVDNKASLLAIRPDFSQALASPDDLKELVLTTKSEDPGYDFYSRCFCPWIGINEDPVTGASHSVLTKYWGEKLVKQQLSAFQLSKRGGFLHLNIVDENTLEVCSNAQIVFEGQLNLA